MSVSDRLRIARDAVGSSSRVAVSRLLGWRQAKRPPVQLVIVPQDLRTADPSFWHEIELGQFGLAGTGAELRGASPFEIAPPNIEWARELHGFSWLRHLDARGAEEARDAARRLTMEWLVRHADGSGVAWEAGVAGRRLISWLSHTGLLLDDAEPNAYEAITQSLGDHVQRLMSGWQDEPEGYPRLVALIALVLADLCIAGNDGKLKDAEKVLSQEIQRQILADGGHVTRNPTVLVELVLDLLPLRQCFASRKQSPSEAMTSALARIPAMLRFMRLGDGMLARFNGVSVAHPAGLATVLAYNDIRSIQPGLAPQSRYARLTRGTSVVVMDAGSPPPLSEARQAHAGCLSFELSCGTRAMLVNGGAPGAANAAWRAMARATASHNTLCLGETSSAELVKGKRARDESAIKGPANVEARVSELDNGGLEAVTSHDGYRERYGLIHSRRIELSADGLRLKGTDRLGGARVRVRLRQDLPFAIHFHLHPEAACQLLPKEEAAEIRLKDGQVWRLSSPGLMPSIEDSTYCSDSAGPRSSLQIVLRGATFGESEINWTLEAVVPAA